jgi:3'-phosphoadenosine 5'-phosphosulfate sulfotransferase (PAPS reductase)/FAD synthetase
MQRTIVWFSCGAASAIAAMYAVKKYKNCEVVYCDTGGEHESNKKFLLDVENLINKKIVILKNNNYKDHFDVFQQKNFFVKVGFAYCTIELKKKLRLQYQKADDIHILGYTLDEKTRVKRFNKNNPELFTDWILIDKGLTKEDCLGILWQKGIKLPKLYDLGYNHNNCIGCVKGGIGYWNKIKKDFPEQFKKMSIIERKVGNSILKHRSGAKEGKPLFLDKLKDNMGRYDEEPPISCSLSCGMAVNELSETIE